MLVAKKIFDSELMKKPPLYSKLFLWMLGQASFKDTKKLKRGEFITTIAEMREAMSHYVGYRKEVPTVKQIRNIYEGLTKGNTIGTTKGTKGLKITILNYEYYQNANNYEGHNERAHGGHAKVITGGSIPIKEKEKKEIYNTAISKNGIPYTEIITYLNQKAKTNYRTAAKGTHRLIKARWNEGFSLEDFKRVIDTKTTKWLTDPNMVDYLRPETLFGNKFESYLNESPKKPFEQQTIYEQLEVRR